MELCSAPTTSFSSLFWSHCQHLYFSGSHSQWVSHIWRRCKDSITSYSFTVEVNVQCTWASPTEYVIGGGVVSAEQIHEWHRNTLTLTHTHRNASPAISSLPFLIPPPPSSRVLNLLCINYDIGNKGKCLTGRNCKWARIDWAVSPTNWLQSSAANNEKGRRGGGEG